MPRGTLPAWLHRPNSNHTCGRCDPPVRCDGKEESERKKGIKKKAIDKIGIEIKMGFNHL